MPSKQSSRWMVTCFKYATPLPLSFTDRVQYAIYQEERAPSTGRLHLQMHIQFKNKNTTMKTVKEEVGDTSAHCDIARGSIDECKQYCSKEDTRVAGPWEFGEVLQAGSNKRKLKELYERSPERMHDEDPKLYRRYLARDLEQKFKEEFKFEFDLRPWQVQLHNMIVYPPDSRSIIWVYGPNGNEGKSTYAKKLFAEGWFYSRGGKEENIKYSYAKDPTRHVVFDIPRSKESYVNYGCIEELKDRLIESTKYEVTQMPCLNNIHVVVMANFLPKLSEEDALVGTTTDAHGDIKAKSYRPNSSCLSRDRVHVIKAHT